jgi:hypothetical protein
MDALQKRELLLYAVVWALAFVLFPSPMAVLPFFLLFLAHNFLAVPFLLRKQPLPYLALVIAFLAAFSVYCLYFGNRPPEDPMPPFEEAGRPPRPANPELLKIVIGLLILLVNLGVKALFQLIRSEKKPRIIQVIQETPAAQADEEEAVLHFKAGHKTIPVQVDQIRYVESLSEYVKIHLEGQESPLLVLYSLKRLMEELPTRRFMRIHRSYIISLSRIREANTTSVVLDDGTRLPVSESYRPAFREYLKDFSA